MPSIKQAAAQCVFNQLELFRPLQFVRSMVQVLLFLGGILTAHLASANKPAEWPSLDIWTMNANGVLKYQAEPQNLEPTFKKHWVEKSREGIARSWRYFNDAVDTYVSNDDVALVSDSLVRLRLGNTFYRDRSESNIDLKFKADLARTENRLGLWANSTFKFFIDTDPEDQKSLQEQSLDRSIGGDNSTDETTAGFSFVFDEVQHWQTDFDIGVRSGVPLDVFSRLSFEREYEISENWQASWRHKFFAYYYRDSGYQTDFKVSRQISEKWQYKNTTEVNWNQDSRVLTYANISSFEQLISNRSYAVWRVGGFYEDYPSNHVTSYFVEISYTRRLYQDWFFVQLVPRVDYFHDNDFASTPSFLLRFDVLFSN